MAHECAVKYHDEDRRPVVAECGICGYRWCDRCDPSPAALAHCCHGRGYSTAEL